MFLSLTSETSSSIFQTYIDNDPVLISLHSPVNDTLDDLFEDSGDEEESQDIVNQVLDEIGIEITGKVSAEI